MTQTTEQERAEQLARDFHEAYERLAPSFGYETRQETRAFDPESANGKLMIAVCAELQAARRAPVVPQGWREALQAVCMDMVAVGGGQHVISDEARAKVEALQDELFAASPQPPEADQPAFQTEVGAAPVQLPDALLTLETDAHYIFNNPPGECPQAVRDVIEWYAASVRQLLAAQEQSHGK